MKVKLYCSLLFALSSASKLNQLHNDAQDLLKEYDSKVITPTDSHFEQQIGRLKSIVQSGEKEMQAESKGKKMHLVPEKLLNAYVKYLKWQDEWLRGMMRGIKQITQQASKREAMTTANSTYQKSLGKNGYLYSPTLINGRISYRPVNQPAQSSKGNQNIESHHVLRGKKVYFGHSHHIRKHHRRYSIDKVGSVKEAKAMIKTLRRKMRHQSRLERRQTKKMIHQLKLKFHVKSKGSSKRILKQRYQHRVHRKVAKAERKLRKRIQRLLVSAKGQTGVEKKRTLRLIKKLTRKIKKQEKRSGVIQRKVQKRIKKLEAKMKYQSSKEQRKTRKMIANLRKKANVGSNRRVLTAKRIHRKEKLNLKMKKRTLGMKRKMQSKIRKLKSKMKNQSGAAKRKTQMMIKKLEKKIAVGASSSGGVLANTRIYLKGKQSEKNVPKSVKKEIKQIKKEAKEQKKKILKEAHQKEKLLEKKIRDLEKSIKGKDSTEKAKIKESIKETKQEMKKNKDDAKASAREVMQKTKSKVSILINDAKKNSTTKVSL